MGGVEEREREWRKQPFTITNKYYMKMDIGNLVHVVYPPSYCLFTFFFLVRSICVAVTFVVIGVNKCCKKCNFCRQFISFCINC